MSKPMNKVMFLKYCLLSFLLSIGYANAQFSIDPNDKWLSLLDNSAQEELSLAPDGEQTIILHQVGYPSISLLAEPRISLAGLEFYQNMATQINIRRYSHIELLREDNSPNVIRPEHGTILDFSWAPDSKSIALIIQNDKNITLWLYDIELQQLKQLSPLSLSARIGGRHLRWLPDASALIVKTVFDNSFKGDNQELKQVQIESTELQKSQGRTYKHLLNTVSKRQQFKNLALSQLVKIDLQGNKKLLGSTKMVEHFAVSPDGNYLLVESLPEKLSPYIPYRKWGRQYQIVDLNHGKSLYQLPELADKINLAKAKDTVPLGARGAQWLPFKAATISWVEPTNNGVLSKQSAINDIIYELASPFNKGKTTLLDISWRYYDINWSRSGNAILQEWRYSDKQAKTHMLKYRTQQQTKLLSQRNYKDKYADIGDPILRRTAAGNLLLVENDNLDIFLRASGQTKTNIAPYIDAYNLKSVGKKRLFTSKSNLLEIPLDVNKNNILVRRESANSPPSYLKLSGEGFSEELLVYQKNITDRIKTNSQIVQYQRSDGINLQGLLHLPVQANKNKGKKIPAVLWIYPREFKNKKLGQQTTITQNKFINLEPSGPLPFLLDGIAVFEATAMPIISEQGEPNDHFIEQLVMNAQATVKALEKTGVIDIQKLAIMGHSYGAFSVANLLAHTDLFQAGIAKSGAYNRTLTPFGFQGERRNLWQAKDSYLEMSPFLYVDQINEPLLLIHGENDLNSGTFPMQSKRMYQALVANKKTAKLIMLPYEGHSYKAKENLHLVLAQQSDWLKKWLNF